MRVRHLDIIAEHVVVAYLQRAYAGVLHLARLHLGQIVARAEGDVAQLVELGVDARAYYLVLVAGRAGVGAQLAGYAVAYGGAGVELLAQSLQRRLPRARAQSLQGLDGFKSVAHQHKLAGRDALARHLAHEALEVAHSAQVIGNGVAHIAVAEEVLNDVQALVDGRGVFQRHLQPSTQHARAHGSDGAVEHPEQTLSFGVERLEYFQIAHREAVETHIPPRLYAAYRRNVPRLGVLRKVKVVQNGTGGNYGTLHAVDAETFERCRAELLAQALVGGGGGEEPVVELKHRTLVRESLRSQAFLSALHKEFLRRHRRQRLVDIVRRALRGEEFTRTYVEQSQAGQRLAEMHGRQEIVLPAVEHIVVHRHTRRHKLYDAPFH